MNHERSVCEISNYRSNVLGVKVDGEIAKIRRQLCTLAGDGVELAAKRKRTFEENWLKGVVKQ
jgi:(p)ppGpp synthase/HD superfamily hydrolase